MTADTKYLRELAARCRLAARICFDLKAQQELREIGDELVQIADDYDRSAYARNTSSDRG